MDSRQKVDLQHRVGRRACSSFP